MMKTRRLLAFLAMPLMAGLFVACEGDDDDDTPPTSNDQEVITELRLTFTEAEGVIAPFTVVYSDPDGPGGNAPTIDPINLQADAAYQVSVQIFDGSENLTPEIQAEDEEHQFFYILNEAARDSIDISYPLFAVDANGFPVGLNTNWNVLGTVSNGTLNVVLRHEPNKDAAGVADGDITNAGGETDIDAIFNLTVTE